MIGATDKRDGMKNLEVVRRIPGWQEKYPVFAACVELGEGWYLPAKKELENCITIGHIFPGWFKNLEDCR